MSGTIYPKEVLYSSNRQRVLPGAAGEAAFLLGGIGTGNVSVGARGEFRDWEIFNTPGKGVALDPSFFAIWAKEEGKEPVCKVLEARRNPPFSRSHGFHPIEIAGLPRFEASELRGEYPMAWITFKDGSMPVEVTLEAFTPMIPLNTDDSGIPCAILNYKVRNKSAKTTQVSIAGSFLNAAGFQGYDRPGVLKTTFEDAVTEFKTGEDFSGFHMYSSKPPEDIRYGGMSLITNVKDISYKTYWANADWWDGTQLMWDDFSEDGRLEDGTGNAGFSDVRPKIGSLGAHETLKGGEEKEFLFILSWYFPNRVNGWEQNCCGSSCSCEMTRSYYAKLFKSSWHVAEYTLQNIKRLTEATFQFHNALFGSTLPAYVIDAAASNMDILRSTTCFRLENGKFFGYEGCFDDAGCCEGNCTHVWNYEQTLAFLYPSLERDMRLTEFNIETDEKGKMAFRSYQVFGGGGQNSHPAADGQLGCIIRLYREWKLSGDNDFLRSVWSNVKKALDFAFSYWDSDGDNVLDSQQHNTYDIEFYGPNSLVNSMFYGALKAGSEMAGAMGEPEIADRYRKAYLTGSKRMDEMLWNGEYYIQVIEDVNQYKYQYGKGCLSDQLLGQLSSHVAGLGYILPEEHVKKAIHSVFKHNFLSDFSSHVNAQRTYALNDEKGLILCSWPDGGRPRLPFVYSDEVWTGIEYQVAVHLIYEGFLDEGLSIVKAVRDRYDGFKRNPWDEVECGHHYARAMASWGLLVALSGFRYDLVNGYIAFNPVINQEDFSCFFSCGKAWGVFSQKLVPGTGKYEYKVKVLGGSLEGITVRANSEPVALE